MNPSLRLGVVLKGSTEGLQIQKVIIDKMRKKTKKTLFFIHRT